MNTTGPDQNPEEDAEKTPGEDETLQERSARLEAEAAQMKGKDPLAPEPEQTEEPEAETRDQAGQNPVEKLAAELAEAREQMMRALADAENTRKRAIKEREDASKFAISGFARELLDVADNLRRALEAVPDDLLDTEPRVKNLVDGVEATERSLLKSFEKNGIQKIDPMGEVFDPNFHEVMYEAPGTGKPPGTVTEVVDVGYMLNDRLLRPARVGVAKDEGYGDTPPDEEPGGRVDTKV